MGYHGMYGPSTEPKGIVDLFPDYCFGAYSIRKLRKSYNGPCMRIVRNSDLSEIDIFFNGDDIDIDSIIEHGRNSFSRVVTWYDQSYYGNDVTQSTNSKRPILNQSSAGVNELLNFLDASDQYNNSKICVGFEASVSQELQSTNTISITNQDISILSVFGISPIATLAGEAITMIGEDAIGKRRAMIHWNGGSGGIDYLFASGYGANTQIQSVQPSISKHYLGYCNFDFTNQLVEGFLNYNNLVSASRTLNNPVSSKIIIGSSNTGGDAGSEYFYGRISEVIYFNKNMNNDIDLIRSNIFKFYQSLNQQ